MCAVALGIVRSGALCFGFGQTVYDGVLILNTLNNFGGKEMSSKFFAVSDKRVERI